MMSLEFKKAIIELWINEFGAERYALKSKIEGISVIDCYKIGGTYLRLDCFEAPKGGLIYCIEAANEEMAQNNVFDDAWSYWDGDGIEKILKDMKNDLSKEFELIG